LYFSGLQVNDYDDRPCCYNSPRKTFQGASDPRFFDVFFTFHWRKEIQFEGVRPLVTLVAR
jgi:hypothetical protein